MLIIERFGKESTMHSPTAIRPAFGVRPMSRIAGLTAFFRLAARLRPHRLPQARDIARSSHMARDLGLPQTAPPHRLHHTDIRFI